MGSFDNFDFWPYNGDFQILRVNVEGQDDHQIQKNSLFLYIGMTIEFTSILSKSQFLSRWSPPLKLALSLLIQSVNCLSLHLYFTELCKLVRSANLSCINKTDRMATLVTNMFEATCTICGKMPRLVSMLWKCTVYVSVCVRNNCLIYSWISTATYKRYWVKSLTESLSLQFEESHVSPWFLILPGIRLSPHSLINRGQGN